MSPHIILILMLSACTLLVMALVAMRKRTKGDPNLRMAPESTNAMNNTNDLSAFNDLNIDEFLSDMANPADAMNHVPTVNIQPLTMNPEPKTDLIELVSRYKFFQGKNLEAFSRFVQEGNFSAVEQLIREKFTAQKKENAPTLASEVTKKLLAIV